MDTTSGVSSGPIETQQKEPETHVLMPREPTPAIIKGMLGWREFDRAPDNIGGEAEMLINIYHAAIEAQRRAALATDKEESR